MSIEALLLIIPACFMINMIPGPNMLLSLKHAVQHGYKASIIAVAGRFIAFIFYASLTALGLGIIIASSIWAFTVIKVIGAIYLVYVGIMTIKNGININDLDTSIGIKSSYYSLFKQEAIMALTNPKIILIFTALLPQFITSTENFTTQFFILTLVFCALELIAASVYIVGILLFADKFKSTKGQSILSKSIGGFLIGFGVLMVTSKQ